jgi:hypothetical protein
MPLSFNAIIAEGYDWARVMSSHNVRTNAEIEENCPFADYYHCPAHVLTLCLVQASKHHTMRTMIGTVEEVSKVSSNSNKKHVILQKAIEFSTSVSTRVTLPGLSETLWVERITSPEKLIACYAPSVQALSKSGQARMHQSEQHCV